MFLNAAAEGDREAMSGLGSGKGCRVSSYSQFQVTFFSFCIVSKRAGNVGADIKKAGEAGSKGGSTGVKRGKRRQMGRSEAEK